MDLKLDSTNVCRICMQADCEMLPIFGKNSISEKVMFCTTIKIESGDGLPEKICKVCSHNLNIAYDFKELCEQSDLVLRECLDNQTESSECTVASREETDEEYIPVEVQKQTLKRVQRKAKPKAEKRKQESVTHKISEFEIIDPLDNEENSSEQKESSNGTSNKTSQVKDESNNTDDFASILEDDFKCYICEVCGKGFDTKSYLRAHVRRHVDVRPFQCESCDKSFKERSTLKVHMRSHTGEKPFTCSICAKSFTQNSSLKNHIRSHTQETPYKCELCGRLFTALSNYSKHYKAHRNERKFVCSICGAAFNFNYGLMKHSMTHTNERPFACTICNKAFTRRTNLNTHMRVHNGETPYTCGVCSKSFRYNSVLKLHLKAKHDIIIPPTLPLSEFRR